MLFKQVQFIIFYPCSELEPRVPNVGFITTKHSLLFEYVTNLQREFNLIFKV